MLHLPTPRRRSLWPSTASDSTTANGSSSSGSSLTFGHHSRYSGSDASLTIVLDDDSDATIDHDPAYKYHMNDALGLVKADRIRRILYNRRRSFSTQRQKATDPIDLTSDIEEQSDEGESFTGVDVAPVTPVTPVIDLCDAQGPRDGRRIVQETCAEGIVYKVGQTLEVQGGSFIRIEDIIEDSGQVSFRGRRLFRVRHMGRMKDPKPYYPPWHKELVWIVNDDRDVPLKAILKVVTVRFTNHIRPDQEQLVPNLQQLFCRLKETTTILGQVRVEYLSRYEADEGYRSEPWELRQEWRGATRIFGSSRRKPSNTHRVIDVDPDVELHHGPNTVDLTAQETAADMISNLQKRRQYTFGDAFCGGGGMSSGANKAGLRNKWAFDNNQHAVETYRLNFPGAICKKQDVYDFLTRTGDSPFVKVDVCHGSPPCQTFSIAHTVESINDDANFACIFACADLVKKVKPRVFTVEETSGLCEVTAHKGVFSRLIQSLLEIGYSVSWGVLQCSDYGVPQTRRRLIAIASGPGEVLPAFPKATHGTRGSGLLPIQTINSKIYNIPRGSENHDVNAALRRGQHSRRRRRAYDPHQPAKTITTGGGEFNYHPSGTRNYTNREFASLQTFDTDYKFSRQGVRTQIGNAVPPVLAKAVYCKVIRSLQQTDKREAIEMVERGVRAVEDL